MTRSAHILVSALLETTSAEIDRAAAQTNKNPSDAQKKAGNYAKGKITLHGLEIAIENAAGSTRSGKDKDGKPWSVKMPCPYGYFTSVSGDSAPEGKDGDKVDCYIGDSPENETVFVVNQQTEAGKFDEHKV